MSIPGERSKPTSGLKGSKGGTGSQPRQRLPKMSAPADASDLQKQSSIYLRERNKQMRAKRLRAEMELAHARGLLIEKAVAEKQLAYLLINLRQQLLSLPLKLGVKFGAERFTREMARDARVLVVEICSEISRLPEAAEPGWLEKMEENEET